MKQIKLNSLRKFKVILYFELVFAVLAGFLGLYFVADALGDEYFALYLPLALMYFTSVVPIIPIGVPLFIFCIVDSRRRLVFLKSSKTDYIEGIAEVEGDIVVVGGLEMRSDISIPIKSGETIRLARFLNGGYYLLERF